MEKREKAEFLRFMEGYADFFDKVSEKEKEKRAALLSGDVARIQSSMTDQQAVVMQLGNLEKERLALQEEIGFGGMTFRQIAEQFEGEDKAACLTLFQRLSGTVEKVKLSNEKSMQMAQDKSDIISRLLEESGMETPEPYSPYSKGAGVKPKKQAFDAKI